MIRNINGNKAALVGRGLHPNFLVKLGDKRKAIHDDRQAARYYQGRILTE